MEESMTSAPAQHVWPSPFKSFYGSHTHIRWHILTRWRTGRGLLSCSGTPMPTERCVSSSWRPQTRRPLDCRSLTAESPLPPETHTHTSHVPSYNWGSPQPCKSEIPHIRLDSLQSKASSVGLRTRLLLVVTKTGTSCYKLPLKITDEDEIEDPAAV